MRASEVGASPRPWLTPTVSTRPATTPSSDERTAVATRAEWARGRGRSLPPRARRSRPGQADPAGGAEGPRAPGALRSTTPVRRSRTRSPAPAPAWRAGSKWHSSSLSPRRAPGRRHRHIDRRRRACTTSSRSPAYRGAVRQGEQLSWTGTDSAGPSGRRAPSGAFVSLVAQLVEQLAQLVVREHGVRQLVLWHADHRRLLDPAHPSQPPLTSTGHVPGAAPASSGKRRPSPRRVGSRGSDRRVRHRRRGCRIDVRPGGFPDHRCQTRTSTLQATPPSRSSRHLEGHELAPAAWSKKPMPMRTSTSRSRTA